VTLERTFTVGQRRAKMELSDVGKFRVLWSPNLPGALSPSEREHYHSGRNALICEMADTLAANGCLLRPYNRAAGRRRRCCRTRIRISAQMLLGMWEVFCACSSCLALLRQGVSSGTRTAAISRAHGCAPLTQED
jgi:hypothetical protein